MSKNTPTTQYLDFGNDTWDLERMSYTKNFTKFYSKPEGLIIITNLSIVYTEQIGLPTPITDVIAIPMQVAINKEESGDDYIVYYPNEFNIEGVGTISISLTYLLTDNTLEATLEFTPAE